MNQESAVMKVRSKATSNTKVAGAAVRMRIRTIAVSTVHIFSIGERFQKNNSIHEMSDSTSYSEVLKRPDWDLWIEAMQPTIFGHSE